MKHIIYKVEKNLDSFYWDGYNWTKDVNRRKVFRSESDAEKVSEKVKGSTFPEAEIKRTADHPFHGKRNLLPYKTLEESRAHRKVRWKLLRTDCTFVGATPEVRFQMWIDD